MIVDLEELIRVKRYLKQINNQPLENITWIVNNNYVKPSSETVKEFEYVGMNNTDFPASMGWYPEDVGVRWVNLELSKIVEQQEQLPEDMAKVLHDNLQDLYEK